MLAFRPVRYELLLQAPVGQTFDSAAVLPALAARHPLQGDPPGQWKLPSGAVALQWLREGERIVALELHLPLAESDTLLRQAVEEAAAVASAVPLVLYDPQMNRPVVAADAGAVANQFQTNTRYAARIQGVPGLTGLEVDPSPVRVQVGAKVLVGILGFLFLLLTLSDLLARFLRHP